MSPGDVVCTPPQFTRLPLPRAPPYYATVPGYAFTS